MVIGVVGVVVDQWCSIAHERSIGWRVGGGGEVCVTIHYNVDSFLDEQQHPGRWGCWYFVKYYIKETYTNKICYPTHTERRI